MKRAGLGLALLCLLCAAGPAWGQAGDQPGLQALLNGAPGPAAFKDLDSSWRQVMVIALPEPDPGGTGLMAASAWADARTVSSGLCYTQGRTVRVGRRTYLVAYRPAPVADWARVFRSFEGGSGGGPEQLGEVLTPAVKPATPLALWLVDVARVQELRSPGPLVPEGMRIVTPMGAQSSIMAAILFPVFAQARAKARATASLSNLRQLALAARMYEQDEDRLPPLSSAVAARKALWPYTKNESIFQDPATGQPYRFNAGLSRRRAASVARPAETVLVYAPAPDNTGRRAAAFVDGHAKLLTQTEWARLKKLSGIP